MAHHVKAISTCSTAGPGGIVVRLRAGTIHRSDEPIVIHRPDLFAPIDMGEEVEQATRAPGEKRNTRRPAQ